MHNTIPVTVIVPVKNEASRIRGCLESVRDFDQVIVVDSQSTDGTDKIAAEMGASVVQFHYDGGWPKKRNWAMQSLDIRNEWIFLLDGDERIREDLRDEIQQVVESTDVDLYFVKWKFLFLGAWMKHSWSHGWMPRLVRRGKGAFEDLGMRGEGGWDAEVHENLVVHGKSGRLVSLLEHENHELTKWLDKQNEFATWNAVRRLKQLSEPLPPLKWLWVGNPTEKRRLLKAWFLRLPCKTLFTFCYLYFFKFGFLDGLAGYYFCRLRANHELNINAKIFEINTTSQTVEQ